MTRLHGIALLTMVSGLAGSALAQPCADYTCDSLAVRAILDANGRSAVRVEDVSTSGGGRIDSLDLRIQWLSSVPDAIGSLSALVYLDISLNPALHELPAAIAGLTSLKRLDARSMGLTALPLAIGGLTSLETLNVGGNELTALPPDIAGLSSLATLDASGNHLASLPPELGSLSGLRVLQLAENDLTALPPAVGGLAGLETLDVSRNRLSGLPDSLMALASLRQPRFWGNPLDSVSDTLDAWLDGVYRWWRCPIEASLPQDGAVYHVGDTLSVTWAVDSVVMTCLCLQFSADSGENFVSPVPSGCMEPHGAASGTTAVPVTASWVATGSALIRLYAFVDPRLAVHSGYFSVLPANSVAGPTVARAQVHTTPANRGRLFDLTGRATMFGAPGVLVHTPRDGAPGLRLCVLP